MFRVTLLLLASLAVASAQLKVAIINTQGALFETAEIKKAQAELEAKFKSRQQQVEKLQKDLAEIQNQLQTGANKLSQQAAANLQTEGQRKQRDLQRLGEDLQADFDRERQDILQRAGGRMQEVVKKMAEARGLDMVVDVQNTIYFKPALEITKDATVEYDKTYAAK